MKKSSLFILSIVLSCFLWTESSQAQNAITYWKDGIPTIIYSPDSIFFWNGDNLVPDVGEDQEGETVVDPTETEQFVMSLTSNEDEAPYANYSEEDSLKYDAMAQEVLAMFATDDDDDDFPMSRRKANSADDELVQEAIRNNGVNIFSNQLIIEQQNWDSGLWGKTHYGGFKTYYNTFLDDGKRWLLVVFYYKGGFPNKKTAYLKLGQVNSGKIKDRITIYPGREYASLAVCIDDYLQDYGCVNFFPLLITEGSLARNYLNPFFVRSKKYVPDGWADFPYGAEFGRINGVSVYCNASPGSKNQGPLIIGSKPEVYTYQCVELCRRFVIDNFSDIKRPNGKGWGSAWEWPDRRRDESGQDKGKYIVFANGDRQVREGDLIVGRWQKWNQKLNNGNGGYEWAGHIGVVVKTTKDSIIVAHQNGGGGRYAYPIGTRLMIGDNNKVRDYNPEIGKSPIYAEEKPITHFIRSYHSSEVYTSYSASLKASTTKMEFGEVEVGKSKTMTFKIKNSGTSTLTISSMTLTKGDAFSLDASSCTIGQGETRTFNVTFTPTKAGEYKDRIFIQSNADDNPQWTIHLFGTGDNGDNERLQFFSYEVDGIQYALYEKQNKEEVQLNADNTPYYKSELMLEITKGGVTSTFFIDEGFFAGDETYSHKCMAIDLSSRMIYLFANTKTSAKNYGMDGFFYYSSLDNINFQRETVFSNANWGWYPYFTYDNGVLSVQHFSFAGYYAMASIRDNGGGWSTNAIGRISPDDFAVQSKQAGALLVIGTGSGS